MDIASILKALIESLAGQNGVVLQVLASIVMFIGSARLVIKPVVLAIEAIVAATATKKDDEILEKVKSSKAVSIALTILNWITSIKLPGAK